MDKTKLTRPASISDEEHEHRMKVARARAEWELGDPSWAGHIIGAYLYPDDDSDNLKREMELTG